MAKVSDSEIDELLNSDEPNKSVKVDGHTGSKLPSPRLHPAVSRARHEVVSSLLAAGLSTNMIVEQMAEPKNGSLTENATLAILKKVTAEWQEEDARRRPLYKSMAIRRITRHIVKAAALESYQSVANLEKVLMMIQGTAEPTEVVHHSGTRLQEAIMQVLNVSKPEEVREMIEAERVVEEHGVRGVKMLSSGD